MRHNIPRPTRYSTNNWGKFIPISGYIKNRKISSKQPVTACKKLEQKEEMKYKISRRKQK